MNKTLALLATLFVIASPLAPLLAQEAKPAAPPPEFKPIVQGMVLQDGDTVVFLGDSITHQCLYTQYVEDYFFTRYPKLRIRFHNAGVGGDRAKDALLRFDDDVARFKPKYVTVLLGMNDGTYRGFDQAVFDTYQQDMTTLLDRIGQLGATVIPMTPTMHDARAARMKKPAEPRDTYYNGVLALYGAWLREQAQVRGLGFVDMYSPLNNITIEQRKKDPKFTMIADAVHPGATGQVVMATAIINDMVPRGLVSAITIQDRGGKLAPTAANGKVTDFTATENGISFTFLANALPWVLPPEAEEGVKLTKLGHKFSNEKITVRNLKPGNYELKIDGQPVGTYPEGRLAFGVELEENSKTPQYQQALKVALLNKERNDQAMRPLRDQWRNRKVKRNSDEKWLAENANDPQAPERREAFEKWLAEFKENVAKLETQVKEFDAEIYQANQPVPRKYELRRVQ